MPKKNNNSKEISLYEVSNKFNTQTKCIRHLEKARWKGGRVCPRCDHNKSKKYPNTKHDYYCFGCKKKFNVLYNTIFQGTKLELPKWFMAVAAMLDIRKGCSNRSISRMIEVEKNTGWRICNKIREAMEDSIGIFNGEVEADEAYIGGLSKWRKRKWDEETGEIIKNKRGVGTEHLQRIWGVVQRTFDGKFKKAQVLVHQFEELNYKSLKRMMTETVDMKNSVLYTDGLQAYRPFRKIMPHKVAIHNKGGWYVDPDDYSIHNNNIESLWRVVKSNINGARHWVSKRHLQKYIDEAVFRYNYKDEGSRYAFNRLLNNSFL